MEALGVTVETTTDGQDAPEGGASKPLSASRPGFLFISYRDMVSIDSGNDGKLAYWLFARRRAKKIKVWSGLATRVQRSILLIIYNASRFFLPIVFKTEPREKEEDEET